jgi:hypothetical protein
LLHLRVHAWFLGHLEGRDWHGILLHRPNQIDRRIVRRRVVQWLKGLTCVKIVQIHVRTRNEFDRCHWALAHSFHAHSGGLVRENRTFQGSRRACEALTLSRGNRSRHVNESHAVVCTANPNVVYLVLADRGDRASLLTAVPGLICGADVADVHLVVTGDVLTRNSDTIATDIGAVEATAKGFCWVVDWALCVIRDSQISEPG